VSIARWNLKEVGSKASGFKEQELHIRPFNLDEFASQNKIQYYQKVVWQMEQVDGVKAIILTQGGLTLDL